MFCETSSAPTHLDTQLHKLLTHLIAHLSIGPGFLHHHKRVRAQVRLEGELVGKVYCNTVLDATWSHDGQGVGDGEMGVGHRGGGTGG